MLRGPMTWHWVIGWLPRVNWSVKVIVNSLVKLKVFYERDYLRKFPVLRKSLGKLQSTYSQVILRSFNVNIQSLFYIWVICSIWYKLNCKLQVHYYYSKPLTYYAKHCLRITWKVRKITVRFLICRNRRLKLYQLIGCDNSSIFLPIITINLG